MGRRGKHNRNAGSGTGAVSHPIIPAANVTMASNGGSHDMVRARLRDWLLWKVLLPFAFLALLWPIYRLFLHHIDAFERAFANGELLLFASLVFIEVGIELRHLGVAPDTDWWCDVAKFGAFALIFVFGFMHTSAMEEETKLPAAHQQLVYYACFSCSIAVFAISVAILTFWRSKGAVFTQQIRRAVNPGE